MDKEKKAVSKKPAPVIEANAVNDDELSDVSGGLWNITILDTCPKSFNYFHCCKNFGKCPNLIINDEQSRNAGFLKKAYSYVFSCAKGYFSQVSYADNAQDED
ncbi:hypothetical protein SDC9_103480 [bioreactor metagenome]|uniref:Uncharacterized protein n=1 Tax=bioreactor metagenome TaxID=1076179 RepID=A0A645AWJ2_9ZZZZ|nr:hypothetical protein [Oscillospiraceae bacterium]